MIAMVLLVTAVTVVAFGIGTAFAVVTSILNLLAPRTRSAGSAPLLLPSQSQAIGD
jgi:hypothetical protein